MDEWKVMSLRKFMIEGQWITSKMVINKINCTPTTAMARIYNSTTLAEVFRPLQKKNIVYRISDGREITTKDIVKANPKISMQLAYHRINTLNDWDDLISDPDKQGGGARRDKNKADVVDKPRLFVGLNFKKTPLDYIPKPVNLGNELGD